MPNPFQIPDTEPGSNEPLCPWRAASHEQYYVDVDSTGAAYRSFETQMTPFDHLTGRGRLVIVGGETGCGKTSLIHRCAERLDTATNRPPAGTYQPGDFIIDLTGYPYTSAAARFDVSRRLEVCREALRILQRRNRVPVPTGLLDRLPPVGDPRAHDAVRDAYQELATFAKRFGFVLIILLPPIGEDSIDDLHEYSWLASTRERLVFFAESSGVGMVNDFLEGERRRRAGTVGLAVSPIRTEDGFTFADQRIRAHPPDTVATVSQREMDRVMAEMAHWGPLSVRTIQKALFRVWSTSEGGTNPRQFDAFDIFRIIVRPGSFEPRTQADGGAAR